MKELPKHDSRYIPHLSYYPIIINSFRKVDLLKIKNAVSALFLIENTSLEEYDKLSNDIVDILINVDFDEKEKFIVWFNSYLRDIDKNFTGFDIDILKDNQVSESMFAENLKKYSDDLIEQGIEQGIEQKEVEMVLRMFNESVELKFISRVSELPIPRVKEIIGEQG